MRLIKKIFSKSRSQEDGIFFDAIERILGFAPKTIDLYKKAFTHRSSNRMDEKGNPVNYERLIYRKQSAVTAFWRKYSWKHF